MTVEEHSVTGSAQHRPKQKKGTGGIKLFFDTFSNKATKWTGSPFAFIIAFVAVIIWACTGPLFHYSDTWQLVINTSTTIITFLMVFLIQQSQNKDTVALHLKLDELLAANTSTSNRLIDVEDLNEDELEKLKDFYKTLRGNIEQEEEIHETHSIDEQKIVTDVEGGKKEIETERKEVDTERSNKLVTKKSVNKKKGNNTQRGGNKKG
jgi:low affinity Fe/Cu permease